MMGALKVFYNVVAVVYIIYIVPSLEKESKKKAFQADYTGDYNGDYKRFRFSRNKRMLQ